LKHPRRGQKHAFLNPMGVVELKLVRSGAPRCRPRDENAVNKQKVLLPSILAGVEQRDDPPGFGVDGSDVRTLALVAERARAGEVCFHSGAAGT
jgi:hypothetical protein